MTAEDADFGALAWQESHNDISTGGRQQGVEVIEITHNYQGRSTVNASENQISPSRIEVLSWPVIDLIQVGNGIKFLPGQRLTRVGDSYTFSFGDYDVVITKRRTGGHVDHKIASLALARKRKELND